VSGQGREKLHGIVVALPTAFDSSGSVTFDAFLRHVDACIEAGVHGFWVNGCTGLAVYLHEDERKRILETALERIAGRIPTWVHVGAMSTAESVRLARHAQNLSVPGVSTLPQEEADRVFERFWRGDRARSAAGTRYGLGLSLVKKTAEVLGGAAEARSRAGGDFEITLSIPGNGIH